MVLRVEGGNVRREKPKVLKGGGFVGERRREKGVLGAQKVFHFRFSGSECLCPVIAMTIRPLSFFKNRMRRIDKGGAFGAIWYF